MGVPSGAPVDLHSASTVGGFAFWHEGNLTPDTASFVAGTLRVHKNVAGYTSGTASLTGTIKITLPLTCSGAAKMFRVRLIGYNYGTTGAWELRLGFYTNGAFPASASVVNVSADTAGSRLPTGLTSVRLGHDGVNYCILLGTVASVWNYPKVVVEEVMGGYSTMFDFATGWSVSVITDESTFVLKNTPVINNGIGADWNALANVPAWPTPVRWFYESAVATTDKQPVYRIDQPSTLRAVRHQSQTPGTGTIVIKRTTSAGVVTALQTVTLLGTDSATLWMTDFSVLSTALAAGDSLSATCTIAGTAAGVTMQLEIEPVL